MAGLLPADRKNEDGEPVNCLDWRGGHDMVSEARFFAGLRQTAENYEAVELVPHHPALPGHYYMHPQVKGDDGKALRELLERFNPATQVDRDLILAFFLSLLWSGPPGQRPAWLFTADIEDDPEKGRGVGKTTLAEIGAALAGGFISVSANENHAEMTVRLLSPDALDKRLVLLDNIKSLKFSWAELEALITIDTISGRRLYHGEGQRPNTLTWCLTLNGATLSKDMAQRCIIVKLKRPARNPDWKEQTLGLVQDRRWEIIGDLLAILQAPAGRLKRHSWWSAWEDAVLAHVAAPAECQRLIEERQEAVDDDSTESEIVRQAFLSELIYRGHGPLRDCVWISSQEAAEIVNRGTLERRAANKACSYLATLHISELRKSGRRERGWIWTGDDADPLKETHMRPRPAPLSYSDAPLRG